MHELCFLSGLSSAEWAAWAQAAGGFLQAVAAGGAVYAAFHVAGAQFRSDQRRRAEERDLAHRQFQDLSGTFASQLVQTTRDFSSIINSKPELYESQAALVADTAQLANNIDVNRVPAAALNAFVGLRHVAAEAAAVTAEFTRKAPGVTHEHWAKRVVDLHNRAKVYAAELAKATQSACFA